MSDVHKSKLAQAIKVGLWGALAVYGAALLPLTAVADSEQTAVRRFDIAAGDLTEVLSRYASAAGAAISFDARQTAGLRSAGLKGEYGVQEGFARILAGSGWQAEPQSNGSSAAP